MKAKLIKQNGIGVQTIDGIDYYLILDNKIYHTNPLTSDLSNGGKLSLKNCQAIEVGYDLDKLSKDFANDHEKETDMAYEFGRDMYSFREGFKKALEILGDKKFTYNDIRTAYMGGATNINCYGNSVINQEEDLQDTIKSLQQDEWDVEICTLNDCQGDFEKCNGANFDCKLCTDTGIPKLDDDGCLILKRI